jgi:hypothetical protein
MSFGNDFSHFNNVTFVIWWLLLPIGISECPQPWQGKCFSTHQPISYISGVRMEYYLMMHCMGLKGLSIS